MTCRCNSDSQPGESVGKEHEALRKRILGLVREYTEEAHTTPPFVAGESAVPISGRVFGSEELCALVDASLDFWLTAGRYNAEFEKRLARFVGLRYALTTNSGSSANLLAVSALTSPKLKSRRLRPGDEVITVAAGFPTTVNPIIQNGLKPVFVDVDIPTYNARVDQIEEAIGERTRAIVMAHTLGNPFDLDPIVRIAQSRGLWLIEDCCDALGSTYGERNVGTFGDMATFSFYPAHHITMGEGGGLVTDSRLLQSILVSIRDWGRDCWCAPGKDNSCGKRFEWKLGELPEGYDHKYTYSHLGYNLKITDMQAAVGVAQMDRVEDFIDARKRNFRQLEQRLADTSEFLVLPEATPGSQPAWFGFPITVRAAAPFSREALVRHLNRRRIATRNLFAGNLIRQPYMQGRDFRVVGDLANTDIVMQRTFWVGVFPGIEAAQIDYMAECIIEFIDLSRK